MTREEMLKLFGAPVRMFIFGGANEGKTTSLLETFPRPLAIINAPGENGHATVAAYLRKHPELSDKDIWMAPFFDPYARAEIIVNEVEKVFLETVKSGRFQTIAFEGLHWLAGQVMDDVTGGAFLKGDDFDGRKLWAAAYRRLDQVLNRFLNNMTPVVALTGWDKSKTENFADPKSEKFRQPNLPGQYADLIKGQVPFCFYHILKVEEVAPGKKAMVPKWQVHPTPKVRGVGFKGGRDYDRLHMDADFRVLCAEWQKLYPTTPKEVA